MKNNIQVLAFLTAISFTSAPLLAQQNAFKYSFSGLGRNMFVYERAVSGKVTIVAGFQKWNLYKTNNTTLPFFGVLASDKNTSKINGHRFELLARRFNKKALNSAFVEGGFYFGKHDITIEKTSSTTNLWAIGFLNFDQIYSSTTTKTEHKAVRVAGAKLGAGYQKTVGGLNLELSGGLNFNAINSHNQRPTAAFKPASLYARLAMGIAF